MPRLRCWLGILSGAILILSSAAHSFMGWPVMRTQLAATNAPADLVTGLGLGWSFGGGAMLAMGLIVLHTFIARLRAVPRPRFPAQVIGVLYVYSGCSAYAASHVAFFIGVFVVPGLLLLVASLGPDDLRISTKPEDRI